MSEPVAEWPSKRVSGGHAAKASVCCPVGLHGSLSGVEAGRGEAANLPLGGVRRRAERRSRGFLHHQWHAGRDMLMSNDFTCCAHARCDFETLWRYSVRRACALRWLASEIREAPATHGSGHHERPAPPLLWKFALEIKPAGEKKLARDAQVGAQVAPPATPLDSGVNGRVR